MVRNAGAGTAARTRLQKRSTSGARAGSIAGAIRAPAPRVWSEVVAAGVGWIALASPVPLNHPIHIYIYINWRFTMCVWLGYGLWMEQLYMFAAVCSI